MRVRAADGTDTARLWGPGGPPQRPARGVVAKEGAKGPVELWVLMADGRVDGALLNMPGCWEVWPEEGPGDLCPAAP